MYSMHLRRLFFFSIYSGHKLPRTKIPRLWRVVEYFLPGLPRPTHKNICQFEEGGFYMSSQRLFLLILYSSLFFLTLHCQSIYHLRLKVPVVMPYEYYNFSEPSKKYQTGTPLSWHKPYDQIVWDQFILTLYNGTPALSQSVTMIKKGEVNKSIQFIKNLLKKQKLSRDIRGKLHNNLGISYLLKKHPRLKRAKHHVDQAGILLSSPPEVLDNVRRITYFFQTKIKFIKK